MFVLISDTSEVICIKFLLISEISFSDDIWVCLFCKFDIRKVIEKIKSDILLNFSLKNSKTSYAGS